MWDTSDSWKTGRLTPSSLLLTTDSISLEKTGLVIQLASRSLKTLRSEGPAGVQDSGGVVHLHKLQPSNGLACAVPPIRAMYLRTSPALEACSRAGVVDTLARLDATGEASTPEVHGRGARFSTNNHRTSTGLWLTSEHQGGGEHRCIAASLHRCITALIAAPPLHRCIDAHSMLHACSHRGPRKASKGPAAGAQAR
jgi:hypothetical protein